jgi:hypothetical protein
MAQRIIKNYTNQDLILIDLGDVVIPANGATDIGGEENKLIQLASSNDLIAAIGQGINKYQVNDGMKDMSFSEGIDCIRKIQVPTLRDPQGRWRVRADSIPTNYDVQFTGSGDNLTTREICGGEPLYWNFHGDEHEVTEGVPSGYRRKRIDFQFIDGVYVKDGIIKYVGAPPSSYIDMMLVCPTGYYYDKKWVDDGGNISWTYHEATEDTVFACWVNKFWIYGDDDCTLGTETASDILAPEYLIWRIEITAPADMPDTVPFHDITGLHGTCIFQLYRARTIAWPAE